jgi:hypothetical protein
MAFDRLEGSCHPHLNARPAKYRRHFSYETIPFVTEAP